MSSGYSKFFKDATTHPPYPYQTRLGTEEWPDVVEVPTGLGKTAGVCAAWLWKRLSGDAGTPRRLVYCLPMRVLVEQTAEAMRHWIAAATPLFEERDLAAPSVHILMGGDVDVGWAQRPEESVVIIGTQVMLLSRALMRGYGMSRYQWALHYGLLHNDALWLFDEIQLMGPALNTSAQVEAFRRDLPLGRPSRTVWMSATLRPEWLSTVDFRPHLSSATSLVLDDADRSRAAERLETVKRLKPSQASLDSGTAHGARSYIQALAAAVLAAHRTGTQTLVILNRVSRAQDLYLTLAGEEGAPEILLLHARFRPPDRTNIERALRQGPDVDRIVLATQAVEAGVDMTSATLFTELAPWPSLVQRFGRCNRYGEVEGGADVHWINLADEDELARPYDADELRSAREILEGMDEVGIQHLPPVEANQALHPVLRRKDFLGLFDTEPDLSGFDVDVSPYIRDAGAPQVQVFWRAFDGRGPDDQTEARREELCPVSMGQIRDYLKTKVRGQPRSFWTWDGLGERWMHRPASDRPKPGDILMLRASDGGYQTDLGFFGTAKVPVPVTEPEPAGQTEADDDRAPRAFGDDRDSLGRRFITLADHTRHVRDAIGRLCAALEVSDEETRVLDRAALWHDVGKAHPAFQRALLDFWGKGPEAGSEPDPDTAWAKSSGRGRLRYRIEEGHSDRQVLERRPHFRHELASMLGWLEHEQGDDRIGYLVAAHHGKLRMALRALPSERPDPDGRRVARGVRDGDVLPPLRIDGLSLPGTELRLDLMELGTGPRGASWTERTLALLDRLGPFRLAWLEALLMVADHRASQAENEGASELGAGGGA